MENKNMVRVMKAAIVEEDGQRRIISLLQSSFLSVVKAFLASPFPSELSMLGSGISTIGSSCLGGSASVSGNLGLLGFGRVSH